MKTVTVVDTSCVVYQIYQALGAAKMLEDPEIISRYTNHVLKVLLSGFNTPASCFLFAIDIKIDGGYWRTSELKGLGINYKGGRVKKHETWFTIFDSMIERLNILGIPVIGFPGYEADDVAALIVAVCRDLSLPVSLYTVDTDWLGLVSETHNVSWFNMGPWQPRLRDTLESVNEWIVRRLNVPPVSDASEIWDIKVVQGDRSDNLPAGTPLGFISLEKPLEGHRLADFANVVSLAKSCIETTLAHDYERYLGNISESIAATHRFGPSPLPRG